MDKIPRLTIIDISKQGDVVECLLETAKQKTVTFKFDLDDVKPAEIAENLVSNS